MADVEVGGVKFSGFGKIGIAVTALSTLAGSAYVGYEFYFDYLDLREVVQEIDIDEIKSSNELTITKLEDAIVYTRDIKNNLRDDLYDVTSINETHVLNYFFSELKLSIRQ